MATSIIASALLLFAAYCGWWMLQARAIDWAWLPAALIAVAAGLLMRRRWGEWLWYVFALGVVIWWGAGIVNILRVGWPYSEVSSSVISLIPGVALLSFCGFGSFAVYRAFRRNKANVP